MNRVTAVPCPECDELIAIGANNTAVTITTAVSDDGRLVDEFKASVVCPRCTLTLTVLVDAATWMRLLSSMHRRARSPWWPTEQQAATRRQFKDLIDHSWKAS